MPFHPPNPKAPTKPNKSKLAAPESKRTTAKSPKPHHVNVVDSDSESQDGDLETQNNNNNNEESESELHDKHKRKLTVLQLTDMLANASTRKRPKTQSDGLDIFKKSARFIPRAISPFANVLQAMQIGLRLDGNGRDNINDDDDELFQDLDGGTIEEAGIIYRAILNITPGLKEAVLDFGERQDVSLFHDLANFFDTNSRFARTDDIGSLRYAAMAYVPTLDNNQISTTNRNKGDRGFAHLASARLLCPRNMLDDFKANPEQFCRDVQEGKMSILADDWPTFLYPEDGYDPNAIDVDLLQGPFLLSCFWHIFTGRRTAMKTTPGKSAGKKGIADLYLMTRVSARNIAYVAVLARYVLSSQEGWGIEDGEFSSIEFFDVIVELFDDPEWSESTLEWWDQQIFGAAASHRKGKTTQTNVSGVSKLAAQRAARKATQDHLN